MTIQIPLRRRGGVIVAHAVVDDGDADLGGRRWFSASGYVCRSVSMGKRHGKTIQARQMLHRVVLERMLGRPIRPGLYTDHINADRLDNRRANLREVTNGQNQQNRRGPDAKNTTGYRNVYRRSGSFQVVVRKDGVDHNGGSFRSASEGAIAADRLRRTLGMAAGAMVPAQIESFEPTGAPWEPDASR